MAQMNTLVVGSKTYEVVDKTARTSMPISFSATLTVAGWSSLAQTVSNSNFVTDDAVNYIVAADSSSRTAYSEAGIYADDVTTAGQMTFYCTAIPSSEITVNIIKVTSI